MKKKKYQDRPASLKIPASVAFLFDNPPLLASDDEESYWELVEAFVAALEPKDVIVGIYVKDLIDLTLEISRIRRFKARLVDSNKKEALENTFIRLDIADSRELKKLGIDAVVVDAESFALRLPELADIQRLLNALEAQRIAVLRFIAEIRDTLAVRLQETSDRHIMVETSRAPLVPAEGIEGNPKL